MTTESGEPGRVVMEAFGAVNAQADEEVILAQESAPLVVQEQAVGLEVVGDVFARRGMFVLELNDLAEEVQAQQGRLRHSSLL